MNFTDALDIIVDLPPNVAVLFVGDAGIGKSTFVRKLAGIFNLKLAEFNCAETSENGDVIGYPHIVDGVMHFAPPPWFNPAEPVLMFLDEINRPDAKSIVKCMMGLALNQKIGEHQLAPNSRVFGAINPDRNPIYEVLKLDAAERDRFWICELESDPDEWLSGYAAENNINRVIMDFIRDNKGDLNTLANPKQVEEAKKLVKYTNVLSTPRSWERFSWTLDNLEPKLSFGVPDRDHPEIELANQASYKKLLNAGSGFVGSRLGVKFASYYQDAMILEATNKTKIRADDIFSASIEEWKNLSGNIYDMCMKNQFAASALCDQVCDYLVSKVGVMFTDESHTMITPDAVKYADSFYRFIKACHPDFVSSIYHKHIKPYGKECVWMKAVGSASPSAVDLMTSILKASAEKSVPATKEQPNTRHRMPAPTNEFVKNARKNYAKHQSSGLSDMISEIFTPSDEE